jgi:uncharacterized cupredoxin-like copper-binding protein
LRGKLLAALVAALVGVAGCGGDDNGGGGTTTSSTSTGEATQAGQAVDVSLVDFKIKPSDPTIDEAGEVEFRVTNDGKTEHNLEVEGPNGEKELPSNLAPGESGTLKVDLSKPGKYEWYCPVGNHRDLGMKGEVTVGGGGGGETTTETDTTETDTTETDTTENSGSGGSGGGY